MKYEQPQSQSSPYKHVVHAGISAQSFQKGFTLLEVLIAVVVLSIGLLGLAILQTTNLRLNQQSLMRSQEAHLAYDMVDRMRTNMPGVNAGAYDLPTLPTASDTNCTTSTGCTPAAMAAQDYFEWNAAIIAMLPGGDGMICLDSTPQDGADSANPDCDNTGNMFAVKLWWDNDRDPATAPQRYVLSFLL
ncbi:MAG: type IV pilus modification protein PilV [Halobacteria archaeon]|nr:type IV pilus modification protein PilV [Halobacteria archaeon]